MAGTGKAHLRPRGASLLRVEDLEVSFKVKSSVVRAVSGVSLDVLPHETVGLVGESGCGKTSLARALMNLRPAESGSIRLRDFDLNGLSQKDLRTRRRQMQMVFQDPISSLNPRRRVRDTIAEALRIAGDTDQLSERVSEVIDAVGLDAAMGERRPHELSGGQCQRVSIARALILRPELVICDEPVSALDVSVQARILNLLEDLKASYRLSYIFVSHDLAVVKNISDRVIVMYLGKLCEVASADQLYGRPAHPYTRLLLDSIPRPDRDRTGSRDARATSMPSPINPPSGCRFRTRCPMASGVCSEVEPQLREIGSGHFVACHFAGASETGTGEVKK